MYKFSHQQITIFLSLITIAISVFWTYSSGQQIEYQVKSFNERQNIDSYISNFQMAQFQDPFIRAGLITTSSENRGVVFRIAYESYLAATKSPILENKSLLKEELESVSTFSDLQDKIDGSEIVSANDRGRSHSSKIKLFWYFSRASFIILILVQLMQVYVSSRKKDFS